MKRYLVFDLDGTLVDSLPGIALAVQRSLARMQRPLPTVQQVRGMIGQGARQLCANALGYAAVESTPPERRTSVFINSGGFQAGAQQWW